MKKTLIIVTVLLLSACTMQDIPDIIPQDEPQEVLLKESFEVKDYEKSQFFSRNLLEMKNGEIKGKWGVYDVYFSFSDNEKFNQLIEDELQNFINQDLPTYPGIRKVFSDFDSLELWAEARCTQYNRLVFCELNRGGSNTHSFTEKKSILLHLDTLEKLGLKDILNREDAYEFTSLLLYEQYPELMENSLYLDGYMNPDYVLFEKAVIDETTPFSFDYTYSNSLTFYLKYIWNDTSTMQFDYLPVTVIFDEALPVFDIYADASATELYNPFIDKQKQQTIEEIQGKIFFLSQYDEFMNNSKFNANQQIILDVLLDHMDVINADRTHSFDIRTFFYENYYVICGSTNDILTTAYYAQAFHIDDHSPVSADEFFIQVPNKIQSVLQEETGYWIPDHNEIRYGTLLESNSEAFDLDNIQFEFRK